MRIANMTPTEQDKELREKLLSLYSANFNDGEPIEGRVGSRDMFSVSVIVDFVDDFIVPFITADRKRVELEARVDEIKLTKDNSEESYLGRDWWADESIKDKSAHEVPLSYFENRITELKAQQEEV